MTATPYSPGSYAAPAGGVNVPCGVTAISADQDSTTAFTASGSPTLISPSSPIGGLIGGSPYDGQVVVFTGSGLPSGITAFTPYWIVNYNSTAGTFNVAASSGGAPTGSGSGAGDVWTGPPANIAQWSQLIGFQSSYYKYFFSPAYQPGGSTPDAAVNGDAPTTPSVTLQYCILAGISVLLCYRPAFAANADGSGGNAPISVMSAGLAAILASLSALQAAGLVIAGVNLCNEPNNALAQTPGITASNFDPMPAQMMAVYGYYYSGNGAYTGLHDAGWTVVAAIDIAYPGTVDEYCPFPNSTYPSQALLCDTFGPDYYSQPYLNHNVYLSRWTVPGLKGGLKGYSTVEFGQGSGTNADVYTQPQETLYLSNNAAAVPPGDPVNSIQAVHAQAKSQGLLVPGLGWWQDWGHPDGPNYIIDSSDYRIPLLAAIGRTCAGTTATCGLSASVRYSDRIYVAAATSAGSISGVADNQGNTYTFVASMPAKAAAQTLTLYLYECASAASAAGNPANPALVASQDIIEVYYTDPASIQAVLVACDTGVETTTVTPATSSGTGSTVSITTTQGILQPSHGMMFILTAGSAGAPPRGRGTTILGSVSDPAATVYLSAAYAVLPSASPTKMQAQLSTHAPWAAIAAANPAQGSTPPPPVTGGTVQGPLAWLDSAGDWAPLDAAISSGAGWAVLGISVYDGRQWAGSQATPPGPG